MTVAAISHEPSDALPEKRQWQSRVLVPEMWAALAITMMWLAVLFDAVFGPDIVSINAGTNMTTVPSAVLL